MSLASPAANALADRINYTLLRWQDAWDNGADFAEVSELCQRKLWQDFKRGVGTGGLDDSVRASVTSELLHICCAPHAISRAPSPKAKVSASSRPRSDAKRWSSSPLIRDSPRSVYLRCAQSRRRINALLNAARLLWVSAVLGARSKLRW